MELFRYFPCMRKPRKLLKGARYHVIARANRREMIFSSAKIKDLFLTVVKRARGKFDFTIENFCIMGNHFHFIIHPHGKESLSRIMQWILSVFAMTFNRLFKYQGHVWGERFYSKILENIDIFINAFEYIDQNPREAGLIMDIRDWLYGALAHVRKGCFEIVDSPPLYIRVLFPRHNQLLITD